MPRVLLIVEDDDQLTKLVSENVRSAAFAVFEASNLAAGITLAKEISPQVVILDLNLPNCIGLESLKRFVIAVPDAIVVVLTADWQIQGKEAIDAGASMFITKPFSVADLIQRVREAFSQAKRLEDVKAKYDKIQNQGIEIIKTIEEMKPKL